MRAEVRDIFRVLTIISVLLLPTGCRRVENTVYSEFHTIGSGGWDPVRVLGFSPWPMDSVCSPADRYSLTLSVRHSPRRAMPPLTLIVRQSDNSGFETSDTIRLLLDPPPSGPGGRGAYGVYETVDTLARGMHLPDGYFVEIQSLSPTAQTVGVTDVGLILTLDNPGPL